MVGAWISDGDVSSEARILRVRHVRRTAPAVRHDGRVSDGGRRVCTGWCTCTGQGRASGGRRKGATLNAVV